MRITDGTRTADVTIMHGGSEITASVIDHIDYDEDKDTYLVGIKLDHILSGLKNSKDITYTWGEIGLSVRGICEKYGMSQAGLGRRFGIPLRTIQNWVADPSTKNHCPCPPYVLSMMNELLAADAKNQ